MATIQGQIVTVLRLHRYMVDPSTRGRLAFHDSHMYMYDVDLQVDEDSLVRAGLHPDLTVLVEAGFLTPASVIRVVEAHAASNMLSLTPSPHLLITQVAVLEKDTRTDTQRAELAERLSTGPCTPLFAQRDHYSPATDDAAMEEVDTWRALSLGELPMAQITADAEVADAAQEHAGGITYVCVPDLDAYTLRRVVVMPGGAAPTGQQSRSGRTARSELLPVVGRLCAVSRIIPFGTTSTLQRCPYYFTFRLIDSSRFVDVNVWNSAAARYHDALRGLPLGSVIAVTGHRIKERDGQTVLAVNSDSPPGKIFRVQATTDAAPLLRRLPRFDLRFRSIKQLHSSDVPSLSGCSFTGIVTRVGPIERQCSYDPRYLIAEPARDGAMVVRHPRAAFFAGADVVEEPDAAITSAADSNPASALYKTLQGSHAFGAGPSRGPWYAYRWVWMLDHVALTEVMVRLAYHADVQTVANVVAGQWLTLTHVQVVKCARGLDPVGAPMYLVCTPNTSVTAVAADAAPETWPVKLVDYHRREPLVSELYKQYTEVNLQRSWSTAYAVCSSSLRIMHTMQSLYRPSSIVDYTELFLHMKHTDDLASDLPLILPRHLATLLHSMSDVWAQWLAAQSAPAASATGSSIRASATQIASTGIVLPRDCFFRVVMPARVTAVTRVLPRRRAAPAPEPAAEPAAAAAATGQTAASAADAEVTSRHKSSTRVLHRSLRQWARPRPSTAAPKWISLLQKLRRARLSVKRLRTAAEAAETKHAHLAKAVQARTQDAVAKAADARAATAAVHRAASAAADHRESSAAEKRKLPPLVDMLAGGGKPVHIEDLCGYLGFMPELELQHGPHFAPNAAPRNEVLESRMQELCGDVAPDSKALPLLALVLSDPLLDDHVLVPVNTDRVLPSRVALPLLTAEATNNFEFEWRILRQLFPDAAVDAASLEALLERVCAPNVVHAFCMAIRVIPPAAGDAPSHQPYRLALYPEAVYIHST